MATSLRTRSVRALGWIGTATALWLGFALGFFLLLDGRTVYGDLYRADPEFQRYWIVNGAMTTWEHWLLTARSHDHVSIFHLPNFSSAER